MGFESFRVELRGGTVTRAKADEAVRRLPHAKPDPESIASGGSAYYTVADGRHVIEVEVADAPVRVSCRFTLCHPPSIDVTFLDLVRELTNRLDMDATICDDLTQPHAGPYPAARFAEFADFASRSIAARRTEWVANFGPAQFPATTPQVYEKVIIPRCVPVAG